MHDSKNYINLKTIMYIEYDNIVYTYMYTHARAHTHIHIKIIFFLMLKSVGSTRKLLSETEVYLFIILVKNLTKTKIVLHFSVS